MIEWRAENEEASKVEPMKNFAKMIRTPLQGIVAWAQARQPSCSDTVIAAGAPSLARIAYLYFFELMTHDPSAALTLP